MKTLVRFRETNEGTKTFVLMNKGWEFIGTLAGSCGPYGDSTGVFANANTTTPLTEWADENNIQLFHEKSLKPVARCL